MITEAKRADCLQGNPEAIGLRPPGQSTDVSLNILDGLDRERPTVVLGYDLGFLFSGQPLEARINEGVLHQTLEEFGEFTHPDRTPLLIEVVAFKQQRDGGETSGVCMHLDEDGLPFLRVARVSLASYMPGENEKRAFIDINEVNSTFQHELRHAVDLNDPEIVALKDAHHEKYARKIRRDAFSRKGVETVLGFGGIFLMLKSQFDSNIVGEVAGQSLVAGTILLDEINKHLFLRRRKALLRERYDTSPFEERARQVDGSFEYAYQAPPIIQIYRTE
ncbi:MAG TPA: hypothetical protein VFB03_01505, partial [Candidatus Saccharimonadales bacterium]|nr:hypothetical protein [Candidatus Saccharimonadales bacterium]